MLARPREVRRSFVDLLFLRPLSYFPHLVLVISPVDETHPHQQILDLIPGRSKCWLSGVPVRKPP
jgi:hypothetical protein